MRYRTHVSFGATNSNAQCMEPPPLTPPRGIFRHAKMCAQILDIVHADCRQAKAFGE